MSEEEGQRRSARFATSTIALVTALIALLSGGVGLLFDVFPGWRPDPRNVRNAELKVLKLEPRVPLDDWLQRTSRGPKDLRRLRTEALRGAGVASSDPGSRAARRQLSLPGTLFYVEVTAGGLKAERVRLRWSIYDHATRGRVIDPELRDVDAVDLRLDAPSDRSFVEAWAPYSQVGSGRYFVRFELRDRKGAGLAIADSRPFRRPDE